ncbi:Heterokaryon incompatibility protein [Paramyrothecium foliicola]|nr:Heterokaryon incompatibility protein [Paramyrothecium foliicola]
MASSIPGRTDGYVYTPLPAYHPSAFRTLELLPGSPADPLRGRLRNHVDENATYEALSYVWGQRDLQSKCKIFLDEQYLDITPNLNNALRRLRLRDTPRILWVDSVCINQTDTKEKSRQVSNMKMYYQYASKVLIYLGEEENGSEMVPGVIDMIYEKVFAPFQRAAPTASLDSIFPPPKETLLALGVPPDGTPEWNALGHLFRRPWWGRYWIIQELVQAHAAELVCGSWSCDWERFATAVRVMDGHPKYSLDEGGENQMLDSVKVGERHLANLYMLRRSVERKAIRAMVEGLDGSLTPLTIRQSIPQWSLIDLLERCRQSQATNPRDYLYAMTGLSTEDARGKLKGISPDYEEDVSDTFIRFARVMVDWGDGIKLLYSASSGSERRENLPSWVPNWSDRNPHARPLSPRFDNNINHYYRAGLDAPAHIRLSTVSDQMVVRGILVDTIDEVGPVTYRKPLSNGFSVFGRDLDVVAASATVLIRLLAEKKKHDVVNSDDFDLIWRTLCCNVMPYSSEPAPESKGDDFRKLLPWLPWWKSAQEERRAVPDPYLYISMLLEDHTRLVEDASAFLMAAAPMCLGRRVAITAGGLCAQVPGEAQSGDFIFLPLGSAVPFVLRLDLDGFVLQGECFVHDIMNGELLQRPDSKIEDITIV